MTTEPTLLFFRQAPQNWAVNVSLASSMQSLESSFLLVALGRHPHALTVCASAIESAIQGADVGAKEKDGLQDLIKKAKIKSKAISEFDDGLLLQFRDVRNRITHRGFSPQDDSESTRLYLDVGLPLLSLCFSEFHKYDLMDGLLKEYVKHITFAQGVRELARAQSSEEFSYCLHSFGHLIRLNLKSSFSTEHEIGSLVHAEEAGRQFENAIVEKKRLEDLFGEPYWSFDCPICTQTDSVVAELDSDAMDREEVIPTRMACTYCGFVASIFKPYLSRILLADQVQGIKSVVLKAYGVV
jgi:hypothetical protein